MLLEMGFHLSKFVKKLVVLQYLDVFNMEVSLCISLKLLPWLSWVDTLEDAESAEVLERDLHGSNSIGSSQILSDFSLSSFLDFLSHFILIF